MLGGYKRKENQIYPGGPDHIAVLHGPEADIGMMEKRSPPEVDAEAGKSEKILRVRVRRWCVRR